MCLQCQPLIKAIDAFLAKEDNDLSDQLAKEGYLLPGETVETVNKLEELVTKLLEDNADDLLAKLNDTVDLKTFFEDKWPEIKKNSNLAKELYKAFKDEFDEIVPRYVEAYLQQADPGLTVSAISQRTLAWVGNWSHDLAGLMKLETETEIQAVLKNGLKKGLGISEVARHIAESGIRSPGYRARRAALTEVLRAHGYAQLESYKQCPSVSEKMWRHTGSYRNTPRQNHVNMDGQRVGVKEPFVLTGADGSTYYPQTPRDTGLPASESVNCHCIMQPVVNEDVLGLPLEERQRLQAEAIAEDDGAWKAELDAKNKAKAGIMPDTGGQQGKAPQIAFKEMSEQEYKEWQDANSTRNKLYSNFEEKYGVKLRDGMVPFSDDVYVDSEGEWLSDLLNKEVNEDLLQVRNGQGHCGYIQDSDGSKAINAYLRRGEVTRPYKVGEIEKTVGAMSRLIESTTLDDNIIVDRWAGIDSLERMGIEVGTHGKTSRIGHAFVTNDLDLSTALENVNKNMVGKNIVDKGLMSASACSSANVFQGSDVKFKIQVPAGTKAFVSDNIVESELVFAPGTKQEVISARVIETEAKDWDDEKVQRQSIEILVRIIGE